MGLLLTLATELQIDTWKSSVYHHFEDPEIIHIGEEVHYKFKCKAK